MKRNLVVAAALGASCRSGPTEHARIQILVNHVGYEASESKHAVIQSDGPADVSACHVREADGDRSALDVTPKSVGTVAKWKTWHYWTLDFDALSAEGNYYIECAADGRAVRSFVFAVRKDLLEREVVSNIIYYFKGQRVSGLFDSADEHLAFEGGRTGTVDARGGWYDATGDYGKHLSHLSFSHFFNPQQIPLAAWSLFRTHDELEKRGDASFRQYLRRLLDEAMFGADFLVRVKNPTGSFYRSVNAPGPEKKPEDRRIGEDAKVFQVKRVAADVSFKAGEADPLSASAKAYEVGYRAGGGLSIAVLAMASRHSGSGSFASAEYLRAAQDAFAFLEKNDFALASDGKENILDDYAALEAAIELFRATEKAAYREAANRRARSLMGRLVTSGPRASSWRADDGDRPFFHPSDAGFPVVALLHYAEIADGPTRQRVLDTVKKAMSFELTVTSDTANPFGYARQLVQNKDGARKTSFFFPHDAETAPWWQGENARLASLATAARLAARHFGDDPALRAKLEAYAWNQLDWILGENPFDACMLHGTGRNNPRYMFFESYEYTNAPGGICNGITSGFKNEDDIDFNLPYKVTGADHDWRWSEQWLPHAAWFLLAAATRSGTRP
jgi:hypothetical protein